MKKKKDITDNTGVVYDVVITASSRGVGTLYYYSLSFSGSDGKSFRGRRFGKDYELYGSGKKLFSANKKHSQYQFYYEDKPLFSFHDFRLTKKEIELNFDGLVLIRTGHLSYEIRDRYNQVLALMHDSLITLSVLKKSGGRRVTIFDEDYTEAFLMIATWLYSRKLQECEPSPDPR